MANIQSKNSKRRNYRHLLVYTCSLIWHLTLGYLLFVAYPKAPPPKPQEIEYPISLHFSDRPGNQADQQHPHKQPSGTANEADEQQPQSTNDKAQPPGSRTASGTPQKEPQIIGSGGGHRGKKMDAEQMAQLFNAGGNVVYGLRNAAGRHRGVSRYGGSPGSESAVELGLRWLARHQDRDGKWSAAEFSRHCPKIKCRGRGYRKYDPAVTGLAFMAFLGAGYTPRKGRYRKALQKTRSYLVRCQNSQGYFGNEMYNHALVLLALLELYGQNDDIALAPTLRRGIAATIRAQQAGGGWTYQPTPSLARNDSSVTGWQVLALTAARRLGFHVPKRVLDKAHNHFRRHTLPGGRVRYADRGPQAFRHSHALSAVALLCGLLCGPDEATQHRQIAILRKNPPRYQEVKSLDHCMYYWYHGTLAMFLVGGQAWQEWNAAMRPMLVARQEKRGHARGSWAPEGKWGSAGGRVYSTAINILNLEIYYRYRPGFFKAQSK